jgi:hypothetical protein
LGSRSAPSVTGESRDVKRDMPVIGGEAAGPMCDMASAARTRIDCDPVKAPFAAALEATRTRSHVRGAVASSPVRRHSRLMPLDDADRLGPKGHVYVELVREQWRAPLERGSARRSLLTACFGVALIAFGLVATVTMYGEALILVGIGLVACVSSFREISALRPEFEEARRIGWVEPSLDDGTVTVGEPATFRAVLHARRKLVVRTLIIVIEARRWHGSLPGVLVEAIPVPVAMPATAVDAGADWRQTVTFRIPPSAPPSHYDSAESVRWTLTMALTFEREAEWRRVWPMLVYPVEASA